MGIGHVHFRLITSKHLHQQTHATRWRQKQPQTHNYKYPLFVAKLSVCFLQRQSFTCLQFCLHIFCFTSVVEKFCFALRSCEAPTTPTSAPIMREGAKVDQPFPQLCDQPSIMWRKCKVNICSPEKFLPFVNDTMKWTRPK